ncbi:hypothetical protein PAXRUDRAFT_487259 [Paxillus rubicundulus Ve08.2h10]|uniref:Uncharacterized protein n=1 Tax=Paxillus rubicundulus Ve08.2h10 TaxID=930991 RepID=A0A0D0D9W2_9AGAM|nr:hypothetical protein PAXRUDRAFT_487259 [Paxillus rubicundulus Ve08.2h10]
MTYAATRHVGLFLPFSWTTAETWLIFYFCDMLGYQATSWTFCIRPSIPPRVLCRPIGQRYTARRLWIIVDGTTGILLTHQTGKLVLCSVWSVFESPRRSALPHWKILQKEIRHCRLWIIANEATGLWSTY